MSGDDLRNAQILRVQVPKEGSVNGSFKGSFKGSIRAPLRDLSGFYKG